MHGPVRGPVGRTGLRGRASECALLDDLVFLSGPAAAAQRYDPSREYAAEKEEFGATRRARWFEL